MLKRSLKAGSPSKPLVARAGLLTAICRNESVSHLQKLIADKRQTATGDPADWANEPQGTHNRLGWLMALKSMRTITGKKSSC
jgi:hypothetical protein